MRIKNISVAILMAISLTSLFSCGPGNSKGQPLDDSINAGKEHQLTSSVATAKEVELPSEERVILNDFFSFFSMVYLKPFTKGTLSDHEMIRFAVYHNYRNNDKVFLPSADGLKARISTTYIDETTLRFFGKKVAKPQSVDDIVFKNGFYEIDQAGGEAFSFSQLSNFTDNGDSTFTAYLNIYTASSGWSGNTNATPEEWIRSDGDEKPDLTGNMKATVKRVEEDGLSRFVLIEYIDVK